MNLLAQEVTKKNRTLVSAQESLFRMEASLDGSNRSLDSAKKRLEELEVSLKECQ